MVLKVLNSQAFADYLPQSGEESSFVEESSLEDTERESIVTFNLPRDRALTDPTQFAYKEKDEGQGTYCTDGTPCAMVTPEPATLLLLGSGLLGVALLKRRRKRT